MNIYQLGIYIGMILLANDLQWFIWHGACKGMAEVHGNRTHPGRF